MVRRSLLNNWIYKLHDPGDDISKITGIENHKLATAIFWGNYKEYCIFIDKDSEFAKKAELGDVIIYNHCYHPFNMIVKNATKCVAIEVMRNA